MTTVDDTFEQLTLVSVQTLKSSKNLKLNQMILAVTWAKIYAIAGKKPEKNPSSTGFEPSSSKY